MRSIQLINHASLIISDGSNSILTDPYLSGSCFNNGWDLIVETEVSIEKLDFDYIWISHEHPDHFSPRDLLRIPEKDRSSITILYQKTDDKKVFEYCISKGFNIRELINYEEYKINENFSITTCQHRDSDSWSLFKLGEINILNLNDCWIYEKNELKVFKEKFGPIDILLTQFSFANWIGNDGDQEKSKRITEWHLNKFMVQNEIVKPNYTIPFASFVYFSHEENNYLNNYCIQVKDLLKILESLSVTPIILFPNDKWNIGESHNSNKSTGKWNHAYNNIPKKELRKIKSKSIEEIKKIFKVYQDRIMDKNSYEDILDLKIANQIPKTYIEIIDLDTIISMDIIEGLEIVNHQNKYSIDIHVSSDSLYYLLENEWGRGTLQINGRFQAGEGEFVNFIKQTQIAFANNINKFYPRSMEQSEIIKPRNYVLSVYENQIDSHT